MIVMFDSKDSLPAAWPAGFFEEIRIADPGFERPSQGEMPPIAALDA